MCLDFEARGGLSWTRAIWGVPGTASLRRVINYTLCGEPPARWFSLVDPGKEDLHPRYLWSARALRLAGVVASVKIPRQIHVPLHNPLVITHWMAETLRSGRVASTLYLRQLRGARMPERVGVWHFTQGFPLYRRRRACDRIPPRRHYALRRDRPCPVWQRRNRYLGPRLLSAAGSR